MLAGKLFHHVSKPPSIVDRRQNLQPFAWRGFGIVLKDKDVVFHAVTRCNMDTTGSLIDGDEVAEQNRREACGQGSLRLDPFEAFSSLLHPKHSSPFETAGLHHAFHQL